ncbi:uncharacterized protein MONBRDRAFT_38857 [Monosiga brevicollis MX1]|uniref:Enoyl reductase (ER) domain-containing protein n=1 Tax=Monosiga brevicollis TaxID=81824 RepID=A9VAK7_MONBE|nr:uncharacterized protein MONBRDRAFT_38857 [Monosiga brevicollis MX1]EDQ85390.1 predicted protein [Monosiga brevicollis MX1]|eukprot:XP_001749801.1 hypothetical protein [Monosiga brevicollis MX1]
MSKNRQLLLQEYPKDNITADSFKLEESDIPSIQDGEVLIKNIVASVDPYQRGILSPGPSYAEPVQIGSPMRLGTVGVVVESKAEGYEKGDFVNGFGGVQDYYVGKPGENLQNKLQPRPENLEDISKAMSVLSVVIGLTAYVGTKHILNPSKDSVFLVSAGAGAVGSLSGQIAKELGATVIGVAGKPEKLDYMKSLGFDHVFNYKTDDLKAEFKRVAPKGITHYFDNTAGPITEAFLQNAATGAKHAVCGAISDYNKEKPDGIRSWASIIKSRITITGFLVSDHIDKYGEFVQWAKPLVDAGKLKWSVDLREGGPGKYVDTATDLFAGKHSGKMLLKLNEFPQ